MVGGVSMWLSLVCGCSEEVEGGKGLPTSHWVHMLEVDDGFTDTKLLSSSRSCVSTLEGLRTVTNCAESEGWVGAADGGGWTLVE